MLILTKVAEGLMGSMLKPIIFAILLGVLGFAGNSYATTKLPLELNRLEQDGDVCRVYLLIRNSDASAINILKLDLVFFDKSAIIQNRLYVELGPIQGAKTGVRLFDIPKTECESLGSILVNDVVECLGPGSEELDCLQRLQLSSRAGVELKY